MAPNVSKTLIRDARAHLKSNMSDRAAILSNGLTNIPVLVVVQRWAVPMKGVAGDHIRTRKWNLLMPPSPGATNPDPIWQGKDIQEGYRIAVPNHGVFMVLEVTDPNTYNVATSVWCVLTNAQIKFHRVGVAPIGPYDAFIQRVSVEEKSYGVQEDWECWYDTTLGFPLNTSGGVLPSKGDTLEWVRAPNPFPGVTAAMNKPKYTYGQNGNPLTSVLFKEPQ